MYYLKLLFLDLPRLSYTLSSNSVTTFSLYLRFVYYLVIKKIYRTDKQHTFRFQFDKVNFFFSLFDGAPDIAALIETFVFKEYELSNLHNPNIIIDIGAHTGNTALYFHLCYPEAIIYAIEASPQNFKCLKQNVAGIKKIVPIHVAVSDTDGTVEFFESKSSLGSSLQKRTPEDEMVIVKSQTLTSFFKTHNIMRADLIKADIEGGEEKLFVSTSPERFSNRYIIEVHEDLIKISPEEFVLQFHSYTIKKTDLKQQGRYMLDASMGN